MHCHDVLGIEETASRESIIEAYANKKNAIEQAADILSPEAYDCRLSELECAQTECLSWLNGDRKTRFEERLTHTQTDGHKQIRLYSDGICIGPCTCLDACFYCGNTGESTCCMSTVGSQTVPIICDVLLWLAAVGGIASMIVPGMSDRAAKRKAAKKAAEQAERNEAVNRVRTINSNLEQEINDSNLHVQAIQQRIDELRALERQLADFDTLFSALGAKNARSVFSNYEVQINQLQSEMKPYYDHISRLQAEITANMRTIDGI